MSTISEYKDKLISVLKDYNKLKREFENCRNELCLKCGNCRDPELKYICNSCKWKH